MLKGTYTPFDTNDSQIGYKRSYQDKKLTVIVNKFHLGRKSHEKIPLIEGESIFDTNLPFGMFLHKK